MSEVKDPTIMLFGRSIPFQDLLYGAPPPHDDDYSPEQDPPSSDLVLQEETEKDTLGGKPTEEAEAQPICVKEVINPDATSEVSENPKTPSVEETVSVKKSEDELSETSVSQEKTLKKPDKIIPCPRCNSMDTKFCYYNNYNVNQARHLCRSCQRYWTAGGTMRNVPVGAGRRKSKTPASHCHHIAISEALHHAQTGIPNGLHQQTNGTVLTFGSDSPLCESMASVFKTMPASDVVLENGDDGLNGSSAAASSKYDGDINESVESVMQTQCFPGAPWPYQWNSQVPPPFFFPPGFPMAFYPAMPYWGCAVPGSCNNPWFVQPPFPVQTAPTLGKHSREKSENMPRTSNSDEENNSKRCLWIPKTLRIDDPGEAAKSSIWATLGIKYGKADSISEEGLFKAFRSKLDEKNHMVGTSPVLHVNPAALSRSLNFQESS